MSEFSRRTVLIGGASTLLVPTQVYAFWPVLARLALPRFFMGVVKSTTRVVLVRLASDAIINAIYSRSGNYGRLGYYSNSTISNEVNFSIEHYKASTIILGATDYEVYRDTKLRLLFEGLSEDDKKRFGVVRDYLAAEKLPVAAHDMKYSMEVEKDTSLDTIISTKWFGNSWEVEKHMQALIDETGVDIFNDW